MEQGVQSKELEKTLSYIVKVIVELQYHFFQSDSNTLCVLYVLQDGIKI